MKTWQIPLIIIVQLQIILLLGSCITAPLEVDMQEFQEVTEEKVAEIRDDLYNNLSDIDLSKPAACPEVNARAAYKIWLKKQFDKGYLFKGPISPLVWGEAGLATHPNIAQCRHIDFTEEYKESLKRGSPNRKREAVIFTMADIKEKLISTKCSANFVDPDQEKVSIEGINIVVKENTLSVKAPTYKIYTSDSVLTHDELEETDAETNLVNNGTLFYLAETQPVPSYFVGIVPAIMESDKQKKSDAEIPIVSLDGTVAAVPNVLAVEPEVVLRAGQEYYVIPKGHLKFTVSMRISVRFTLKDAACVYDQFKDSIRKEMQERER